MDKECDGGFLEAQTRIIKHSVFDASAMDRMLQFMYRSDYKMQTVCLTALDPTSTEKDAASPRPTSDTGTSDEESGGSTTSDQYEDDHETVKDIIAHLYVYAIADYYELPALQDLAVEKFTAASIRWKNVPPGDLVELASVVYSNTTDKAEELRHQLYKLVCRNPWVSKATRGYCPISSLSVLHD